MFQYSSTLITRTTHTTSFLNSHTDLWALRSAKHCCDADVASSQTHALGPRFREDARAGWVIKESLLLEKTICRKISTHHLVNTASSVQPSIKCWAAESSWCQVWNCSRAVLACNEQLSLQQICWLILSANMHTNCFSATLLHRYRGLPTC